MGFPKGNTGMIIAAMIGALATLAIFLILIFIYIKRKKPLDGYKRMSPTSSEIYLRATQRNSRALSIFSIHGRPSIQENGKAPEFDIPIINTNTKIDPPKRTCQLHFSLFHNCHLNELKVQVIQAQNLPNLFGLQAGVLVKVSLLGTDGQIREKLGKTSISFRKNSVFNSVFTCTDITSADLHDMIISLSLHSQERFGQTHFVGVVTMKFSEVNFKPDEPVYFWRPIQRKNIDTSSKAAHGKGQLFLSLRYQERTSKINVIVMKAANLPKSKRTLRADPYVQIKLLYHGQVIEKKRTQPCKGTHDPVWNEPFVFDWKNGTSEETGYKFVFEVKSSDMVMPDASLGVVEICQETSEHWTEMMEKKNFARAMCHNIT